MELINIYFKICTLVTSRLPKIYAFDNICFYFASTI
jgi:hypothetical protein